jgi:hypothetical protein
MIPGKEVIRAVVQMTGHREQWPVLSPFMLILRKSCTLLNVPGAKVTLSLCSDIFLLLF